MVNLGVPHGPIASVAGDEQGLQLTVVNPDRSVLHVQLGIVIDGVDLSQGSEVTGTNRYVVDDSWRAVSGKSTGPLPIQHVAAEIDLRHSSGRAWQVQLRASAEGIAIRYALPGLQGTARLEADKTVWQLSGATRTWIQDYQTWYERPWHGVDLEQFAGGDAGFPILVRLGETEDAAYVLLTESGIDGRFCGAHPVLACDGRIALALADAAVEVARGPVTPWRVMIVGNLATIVESRFVEELAPAPRPDLDGADWVRPGRAAWSWWADFYSGAQLDQQRHYVDVAADLGWEHLLIDCGWEETWVPEIVAYASHRGIQVHLWTVWHDLDGPEKLAKLALWRSWGVAGVKVDFMESEAKDRYRWYDAVLAETARLGLMVNFHGSVIPRGWVRTWPHVVGMEAVRGSEYYVFNDDGPLTAEHNVILPFTRNVVGAMDFTPVAFGAPGRTTSDAHELAQAVAFECGITHYAAGVDDCTATAEARRLLQEVPARWDETRLLAGLPDTEAVLARRSAERWFIGGIATGPARTLHVPLERLDGTIWRAWIVEDGPAGELRGRETVVDQALTVGIQDNGGFAAILAPVDSPLWQGKARPALAAPQVEPARVLADENGQALLTVSPSARLRTPPGWSAQHLGAGTWRVSAPPLSGSPGLGVVTVEEPGADGVPNVSHARVTLPLSPNCHQLSQLPMLSFSNFSGPVERNMSNGGGNPADGAPMRIAGVPAADGFGVSTPSRIELALDGQATLLTIAVGIDDETPDTSAIAEILGDGASLAVVQLVSGVPPQDLELVVVGVRTLELRTHKKRADDASAHVDWARGRLHVTIARTPPAAPACGDKQ